MASIVSSTKPDSFSVSVWMATCTSYSSATRRRMSMTAGVVPQSSWTFRPQAPASDLLVQRPGQAAVALAEEADVDRQPFGRLEHPLHVPGAGRAGRGVGAGGRPGAAADHRRHARGEGRPELLRADEVDVGVDAAGRGDQPLGGDDLGPRADDQLRVDARLDRAGCPPCRCRRSGRRGCRCRP